MSKVLSFSVASYNIEQYIDKLMQTLLQAKRNEDIEILIVNDGSKDRTVEIAKEYEDKYPDVVRLIDKENGGHGSTINRGIREASGKYFKAIDGDDWVNPDDLSKLVDLLKKIESDMVICNYDSCHEDGKVVHVPFENVEHSKEYTFEEIAPKVKWIPYHTAIFKTETLKKNYKDLDEHCFYVDTELMLFPIPDIKTVTYLDLYLYCYRIGLEGQSISVESKMKNVEHSKRVAYSSIEFYSTLENLSKEKKDYILNGVALNCSFHCMTLLFFAPDNQKWEELKTFDSYIKENNPDIYHAMVENNISNNLTPRIRQIRKFKKLFYKSYGYARKFLVR